MSKCCIDKVLAYFKDDMGKMLDWYVTPNPALGNIAPYDLLKLGRHKTLHKFIDSALEGNRP